MLLFYLQNYIKEKFGLEETMPWVKHHIGNGFAGLCWLCKKRYIFTNRMWKLVLHEVAVSIWYFCGNLYRFWTMLVYDHVDFKVEYDCYLHVFQHWKTCWKTMLEDMRLGMKSSWFEKNFNHKLLLCFCLCLWWLVLFIALPFNA